MEWTLWWQNDFQVNKNEPVSDWVGQINEDLKNIGLSGAIGPTLIVLSENK